MQSYSGKRFETLGITRKAPCFNALFFRLPRFVFWKSKTEKRDVSLSEKLFGPVYQPAGKSMARNVLIVKTASLMKTLRPAANTSPSAVCYCV
jgi:hypothetical protein